MFGRDMMFSQDVGRVVGGFLGKKSLEFQTKHEIIEMIRLFKVDLSMFDNHAIVHVASHGPLEVVSCLIANPRVDPSAQNGAAIRCAAHFGQTDIVRLLLSDPRVDPSAENNYAITAAAFRGHTDVVRILLADPRLKLVRKDQVCHIMYAAMHGHADVLKLLLADTRFDPCDQEKSAIVWAGWNGQKETVRILLTDQRVRDSLQPSDILKYEKMVKID